MSIANFNSVLVGANFPIPSIRIEDFKFRHRSFTERMRIPFALQAEAADVELQVLPDRFQISITRPDDLRIQTAGLIEVVESFFQYVGPRSITAVGHNVRWNVPGTAESKHQLVRSFVNESAVQPLGVVAESAQVVLYFPRDDGSTARLTISALLDDDLVFDFNFHYDLSTTGLSTVNAVAQLETCLGEAERFSVALQDSLLGSGVTP